MIAERNGGRAPAAGEPDLGAPDLGPLVSVIIPVYQGEGTIVGAVRSVLRQTYRNLEVFVIDDGSTDGTVAALAHVRDARLHVLRQSNAGTAAARNVALRRARGRFIAFLDSDDRWLPSKIAAEVSLLQSAPEPVAIAYSSHYAVDDEGRLLHFAPVRTFSGKPLEVLLDGEDFLMPSLCLFDRRIFDAVGLFDAERYHEDFEFILRAGGTYSIFPTGKRLVVYRQSTQGKCRRILADFERALHEELSVVSSVSAGLTPAQLARLQQNALRSLCYRFLMYGFNEHARRLLAQGRIRDLRRGKKGWLAWFFVLTGVNALAPARIVVQTLYRVFRQPSWRRALTSLGMDLQYAG